MLCGKALCFANSKFFSTICNSVIHYIKFYCVRELCISGLAMRVVLTSLSSSFLFALIVRLLFLSVRLFYSFIWSYGPFCLN